MDRKKPALTSPWKVGFLVALLMVVMAIGVSYLISGTFAVSWHWIHFGGLSPATWTFNLGAFLEEMAPLLALTALLAFAAYVLVAGAVRRYKAYVDSGVEYKQLLKSIKSVENLEDDSLVEKLKQHPELRDFLIGIKHRLAAHERQNEKRPASKTPAENRAAQDERPRWQSESASLARAIASGRDAFMNELALTVPELKQIERALHDHFSKLETPTLAAAPAPSTSASDEADALRASLRAPVTSMRRDVEACATGARELESAVAALCAELASSTKPAGTPKTDEVRKRVDATAQALGALGEETRRIAIAAAMQASGGPDNDTIKVADELKTLATRFNTVAQHWRQTVPQLKELLGAPAASGKSDANAATAAAAVVNRARLWSERSVAINEQLRSLEQAIRGTGDKAVDAPSIAPTAESFGDVEKTPVRAAEPSPDPADDIINRGAADVFASENNDTDVSFMDIPGFEKERRFFGDTSSGTNETDDRFEVDNAQDRRWDLADDAAEEEAPAPATTSAAPAPQPAPDNDGFLTGPRPVVSPKKIARPQPAPVPRASAPEVATDLPSSTATLDPDADAIDLYALGAVDCVQTV